MCRPSFRQRLSQGIAVLLIVGVVHTLADALRALEPRRSLAT